MRYEPEYQTTWKLIVVESDTRVGSYIAEPGDTLWEKRFWHSGSEDVSAQWAADLSFPRERWYQFWRKKLPKSNLPVAKLLKGE